MSSQLPGNHLSYKKHRRQFWLQIFLPLIITILLIITIATLTTLSAFGENGDAPRWAAISTIWLVIPVMILGLLFLVLLITLIYLLARTLNIIPPYSSKAQHYVNRGASEIKHFSDMAAKPILFIEGIIASLNAFFGKD